MRGSQTKRKGRRTIKIKALKFKSKLSSSDLNVCTLWIDDDFM